MVDIWQSLTKPIICMAPMDGVTDTVFRQIICDLGKPDLIFTEFINVQQIFSHDDKSIQQILSFTPKEKPIIAQLWGLVPELFESSADLLVKIGFDGIDLNFGCPEKNVTKKGAGAALIDNRSLSKKIILATLKGAAKKIPVSVKTRLGFSKVDLKDWIEFLLGFDLSAITIHARTAKQMSKSPADWRQIKKAVAIRDKLASSTLIIGNGDVVSLSDARQKVKDCGVDGVMIGRGVLHDPYFFNPEKTILTVPVKQKINLLIKHINLFDSTYQQQKSFHVLKRFFKIYINGFDNALTLRTRLMDASSTKQAKTILLSFKP